jgi:methylenetetrahydrofolate--tRNA-(uracil-5-)-methyltransferase
MCRHDVTVVGGGLAGCEAALTLARAGCRVRLFEMRPARMTPAHETGGLGELVCSNSLGAEAPEVAAGLLKEELRRLDSPAIAAADRCRVPAGAALAVDRKQFSAALSQGIEQDERITLLRQEVVEPAPLGLAILAPGPLASDGLMASLAALVGTDGLFFFDAIAPIVEADSLDLTKLFAASRYGKGEPDYLNAPLDRTQYEAFVTALLEAEKVVPHGFEADSKLPLFSGCQPVEAIAQSGPLSLAHGPLKPKGFRDNPLGRRLFAVVQLRAENRARTAYNLVGFQTRLKHGEQKRVFRMIPGLEQAEFLRLGTIHRNSYLDTPRLAAPDLSLRAAPDLFVAGQFAGAEGYVESIALGALSARFVLSRLGGRPPAIPPPATALGSLLAHVTRSPERPLTPSNIHWGLFPPVEAGGKKERRALLRDRARMAMGEYLKAVEAP